MSRRNQANTREVADLKVTAESAKPKSHSKTDSRKSKSTRLQNLQVQDSHGESHSEPDMAETECHVSVHVHMYEYVYLSLSLYLTILKPLLGFYVPVSKPYKFHVVVKLA